MLRLLSIIVELFEHDVGDTDWPSFVKSIFWWMTLVLLVIPVFLIDLVLGVLHWVTGVLLYIGSQSEDSTESQVN